MKNPNPDIEVLTPSERKKRCDQLEQAVVERIILRQGKSK